MAPLKRHSSSDTIYSKEGEFFMYGFHLSDNIVRLRRERKMTQEEVADSFQISEQNDMLLIQAYQMAGELEKAKSYTQIRQYLSMLKLVNTKFQDHSY